MATSSITKDFYVKDEQQYKKLVEEVNKEETPRVVKESPSIKRSREKLATFAFR